MQLHDVRLSSVADRDDAENTFKAPPTTLVVASSQPVYFVWSAGKVAQIYVSDGESEGSADVKRGVIGLLQMQDVEGEITEVSTLLKTREYSSKDSGVLS